MAFLFTLADLAGFIALLLWGIRMVQTGVQRAFGARLRSFLGRALRTRATAFVAGLGVTAILQSSTATGLMVTGFAAAGLVDLAPALAVMLGANLGTTLIVQALSFDVAAVAPLLILAGVVMFRRAPAGPRDFGRVLIGLGLLLIALREMVSLLAPFEQAPGLRLMLTQIASQPVLDVLVAAVLTWAMHSSVAVVLLIMSLAGQGVVPPPAAFSLVLGANLGTAINPVLEGAGRGDPAAKRVPYGNLINRAVGVIAGLLALPYIGKLVFAVDQNQARAVADLHTLFNLVMAALFFPWLGAFARLLQLLLPARVDPADPARPRYLDPAALEMPVVALGAAAREALRLADVLESMLLGLRDAFQRGDRKHISETRRLGNVLDQLTTAIKAYISRLDPSSLSRADHHRLIEVLTFATNMKHAGDIVDRNLLALVAKKLKRGLVFDKEEQAELLGAIDRLIANVRVAASLLMTADDRAARLLANEKETFRQLEAFATESHFSRLRVGSPEAALASSLHLDALRDLQRVNAHLVAAAAYPVLEDNGVLLPTRLRD
ncbi:MAG: Na/Pi cotransporter family protein [Acetobacteraceae bacterium]|nr:Na/Pi cotransporter family protein [Acetobacteraceae bacterium]MBV8526612.1 Na/Pi cotransporter family protein [Acetobacteraceae bacterium]